MKELLIIPFLLTLLFFGVVLYAADNSGQVRVHKVVKQEFVKNGCFELKPSLLLI